MIIVIIFQQQLKNIITAVLSRRNAYKSRDKRFMYSMGSEAPVTHLRNSTNIQDDSEERWVKGLKKCLFYFSGTLPE